MKSKKTKIVSLQEYANQKNICLKTVYNRIAAKKIKFKLIGKTKVIEL